MKVEKRLVRHGIFWLNSEKQIQCPECNSARVICHSFDKKEGIYCGLFECSNCKCLFEITRKEMIMEEKC